MVVACEIFFCHLVQPHCQQRLFRRVLGHAIRFGEAQNPGPDSLLFGLCNPTSLANKVPVFRELLQDYHCHFVAAAETSATAPTQALVARNLKKLGFFSAFTTPAPSLRARQDQQISMRGKATGCANFSLFPMRFARCPKLVDPGMDLRFMHVIVDAWKLQIITIYGLTSSHSGAQDFNNALLALAAQRVKQVNLPAIVMGDFNADVTKLLATSDFAQMGFLHLQQLYTHMYGEAMPPSCKEATNPDTAFLSPELASRLTAISVLPDSLFDAHKVVTFRVNLSEGPWLKQVWPKPKAFTAFALPAKLLEEADQDLQSLDQSCTLEEWGSRVEQTVDVALRKSPVGANLPRHLPAAFRGRCKPSRPKTILVTDLVPKARHGDFEPVHEIHGVRTAGFIRQLRRIQSLRRKLSKLQPPQGLDAEWYKILRFQFCRKPFVFWIQSVPELGWVPAGLPPPGWLFDVEQLWKHEVDQAISMDARIHQDKLLFRQKLDAKYGHNKLTFASVRGSTPTLESIEKEIEQTAICVLLSGRLRHKQAEQFEAFVDSPSQFQVGQPISLDDAPGWLLKVKEHSLIVSCSQPPQQLEEVAVRQRVLTTSPAQICHHLTQFWQPLWERDDSHLLTPDLDREFGAFLDRLPHTELSINCTCLDTWLRVIKSLKWNAAPGPDGITAFELQSLPSSLIASLIKVVDSYHDGFPSWFMAAKVFAAPKGDGVPEPSRIRPITVLSQIYRVWAQVICHQALRCLGLSMTPDITGLLPGRGAFLAAYHTQWFFEQAHFQQESCAGVTLDLVKCFNAINRPRGIAILARLGLPAEILHMWAQSLHKLTRRWEVCGQCSEVVASSCGFPEGDVFSVLVMLGVAQCWTIACRQHTCDSTLLSAYADNWSWAVKKVEEIGPILEVTLLWTRIIGLQIDWSKTWWWSSHHSLARHIQQAFQSRSLPAVERALAASDLGCPLRYQGAVRLCKLHSRLAKAKDRLTRLKYHATDMDAKAKVISASVYPVAFHGAELCPIGSAHTRSLRHHVAEALVGPSESMCAALVTLCASRYVKDPELQVILNACAAARRFLLRQTEAVVNQFLSIAARYFPRANTSKGPATTLKAYISRLGWTIDQSGQLTVTAFIRIHLLWSPWQTIVKFAERSWQDRLLTMHSHRASLA